MVAQVGSATTATGTTTAVVDLPSGAAANDVLLASITFNDQALTPPSGWTIVQNTIAGTMRSALYYKVATGSEPANYTWSVSVSAIIIVGVTAWRGVNISDPAQSPIYTQTNSTATTTNPVTTPARTTGGVTRVLNFRASRIATGTPMTYTAADSELFDFGHTASSVSYSMALYDGGDDPAGTVGQLSITSSDTPTNTVARTIALTDADTPKIVFMGMNDTWSDSASGSTFTLNKPTAAAAGDLLLGFFITATEQATSISPPTGWTEVRHMHVSDGLTFYVMKRTMVLGDPTSWTDGAIGSASARRSSVVLAYRDCAAASSQFLAEDGTATNTDATTVATPTVNNTNANSWAVAAFGQRDGSNNTWTNSGYTSRASTASFGSAAFTKATVFDSALIIATGNVTRTGTSSATADALAGWIGVLLPEESTPSGISHLRPRVLHYWAVERSSRW